MQYDDDDDVKDKKYGDDIKSQEHRARKLLNSRFRSRANQAKMISDPHSFAMVLDNGVTKPRNSVLLFRTRFCKDPLFLHQKL